MNDSQLLVCCDPDPGRTRPTCWLGVPQSPVQGRFNLPYEVNWENTVVPAGEYEFYLGPAGGPPATGQSTHSCQSATDPSWPDGPSG
jgi:hypothetical protein